MHKEPLTIEGKFQQMTESPLEKLIIKLAIPTMISMMITSLYNMADTFFVGKISEGGAMATSATGAVGVAYPLMAIIQAFGFMFGQGSGSFISRALGRQDVEKAEKMASLGFFSALMAGAVISIIGLIFLEPLVWLLGSTETIMPYAKSYISIILIGCPWMASSLVLNNQMRFQGNALFSMIGITTGGIINIALDPLFIFTFRMGIKGAALATIVSQFISFCLLFWGTRKSDSLKIRFRNFQPKVKDYVEMFKGGLPSLCRQGISSVATICLNHACGGYGDAAISAMSIVARIMQVSNSLMIGFGQGFQPVCGFNYGAKRYDRVKKGFWFCVKIGTCFLLVLGVVLFLMRRTVIGWVQNDDPLVIEIGAVALRWQSVTLAFSATMMISNMMMQVTAHTLGASLLAMGRQGLFFIPLVLIFPKFLGLFGIQIAQSVADVCSFILSIILQRRLLQEMDQETKSISIQTES